MRTKGLYIHLRKEGGKEMRIPDTGLVRSGYKEKLTTALGLYNTHSPFPTQTLREGRMKPVRAKGSEDEEG